MHLGLYICRDWHFHTLLKVADTGRRNIHFTCWLPLIKPVCFPVPPTPSSFIPSGVNCQVLVKVYRKGKKEPQERGGEWRHRKNILRIRNRTKGSPQDWSNTVTSNLSPNKCGKLRSKQRTVSGIAFLQGDLATGFYLRGTAEERIVY